MEVSLKFRFIAILMFLSLCLSLQALPRIKHLGITVDVPVEYVTKDQVTEKKTVWWVVTARLENRTPKNRNVVLGVTLQSDHKRVDQEYQLIYCEVNKSIQRRVEAKKKRKYLDYIDMSKKTFRRGEVRDVIFVFKRPSRYSNNLTLFVEGLSDVTVRTETKEGLKKSKDDFFTIATPREVIYKDPKGREVVERRFKELDEKEIEALDKKKFKEYLIYRRGFERKGDEFHVHEDDIHKKKHEMKLWVLMLAKVLPGFPESE
jgi:hypothetical protein